MLQRTVAPAPFNEMASSASTSYPCYDVFINHRGPDCKHTFATRLYHRLCDQGLQVFLDEQELIEGYNITSQLEAAIRGASVQVAIFSPTYAKSEWCLNELVLMVKSGSTVLPVFYGVEPSVLRWTVKGGAYGEALQNLKEKTTRDPHTGKEKPRYDSETIQSWRDALSHVAGISGFVMRGDDEYDLLEKVVEGVVKKVPKVPLDVAKYPTGLGEKLQDFERTVLSKQQELKTVGARVAAIVGAGGLGKTTLAKQFFNLKRSHYKESVFLPDVRETARKKSLNYLQSRLIQELKHKDIKIENPDQGIWELKKHLSSCHALIILDDVDHIDQMEKLSSMKDSLSPQSLILVTSRDWHVLRTSGVEDESIYNLEGLSRPDSKELFCCHAFHQRDPPEGFADLVDRFVKECDGLPLSLKVFGAAVYRRQESYWEEFLEELHRLPPEIQNRLRISYDSLEDKDRQIFLDIVCFFIGEEIDTAKRIWGVVGLENLESKCLLELDSEKKIKMHDQIRDMGRIIAKEESMPRRLSQIDDLLAQTSSVVTKVRGISMVPPVPHSLLFSSPSHLKDPRWNLLKKLRYDFMNLEFVATEGDYLKAILRRAPSVPLRWLRWYHFPDSSLPSWVTMENLRVLEVAGSRLEILWQDKSQAPLQLRELNIYSPLSSFPNSIEQLTRLEKIFVGQESLILPLKSLPEEFCNLHSLKWLTLQRCSEMVSLPESFGKLINLQHINLNRASSLMTLPNSFGNLTNLRHFEMSGASSWETLPNCFGNLANLQHFTLLNASRFQTLPSSFGNLRNLQHFEMSGASSWETFPSFFGNLTNLQHFTLLDASRLKPFPNSFGDLINLQHFELSDVSWEMLPNFFGNFTNLQHFTLLDASMLGTLPNSFGNLTNLRYFELSGVSRLKTLPESFENLTNINIYLSDLSSLQTLPFGNLTNVHIDLSGLSNLKTLHFGNLTNVSINLEGAPSLDTFPLMNFFGDLTEVSIKLSGASSLETLLLPTFFGNLAGVNVVVDFQNANVNLSGASSLEMLPRPNFFGDLTDVSISIKLSGAFSLEMLLLPNFSGNLRNTRVVVDFQNVNLNLSGAPSLKTLPHPIFFGDLKNVGIRFLGTSSLEMLLLPVFFGNLKKVDVVVDFQNGNGKPTGAFSLDTLPVMNYFGDLTKVSIKLSGASSLETLPVMNYFGDLTKVSIKLSGASRLETLLLPTFFGNLAEVDVVVDFQNANVNLSGASSLEMLPRPNFFGDLTDVSISIKLSGAFSLEMLVLPNFFGNLRNTRVVVDFQNVNINLSGAPILKTLPHPIFFGDLKSVGIRFLGTSSLEMLLLPVFFGNLTEVDVLVDFQNGNVKPSGAFSLETLPVMNYFGDLTKVSIKLSGASSLETLPVMNYFGDLTKVSIKLSGASILETPLLPTFFGNLAEVEVVVDFQNDNVILSGASSSEMLPRPNFFGDLTNVTISIKLSGAFSLEMLVLPNFFGNLTDAYVVVDFQNVKINLSGAPSLKTLPDTIFLGDLKNVMIKLLGGSSLEVLPFPIFFGNLRDVLTLWE